MKKAKIFLICFLTAIYLISCGNDTAIDNTSSEQSDVTGKSFSIAYCYNDVLNPYKAVTEMNQKLSFLIFDSLITLDEEYNVVMQLADDISLENNICKVILKSTVFSDGSPLTASDIIYSAECAKQSGKYKELFSSVSSITADNTKTVIFNLTNPDPYFTQLLTFPILKKDTGDLKADNNLSLPPIGCGKYIPDLTEFKLIRNENYSSSLPTINEILLINIPDYDALSYAVTTGKISLWQDSYKGADTLIASGGTVSVTSNNFIYIGINSDNKILSIPQMRYALSAVIDRSIICDSVFESYAKPTSGIYNPSWAKVSSIQENSNKQNNNIFLANLKEIDYNNLDASGYRLTNEGNPFEFRLVYCNDSVIKTQLANELYSQFDKAGIKINLVGLGYEEYIAALNNKSFDLYIAETIIENNMNISSLVSKEGHLNYGGSFADINIEQSPESQGEFYKNFDEVITSHNSGDTDLYNVIHMFNLQMPLIPICYKSNTLSYVSGVTSTWSCSPCNPYYVITDCIIK